MTKEENAQELQEQRKAIGEQQAKTAAYFELNRLERVEFDKRQASERLAQAQLDANRKAPQKPVQADVEMITIPKAEYDELLERSKRLFELEEEFS